MNKQNFALSISVGLLAGISFVLATVFNDYIVWIGLFFGVYSIKMVVITLLLK